MKKVLLSSKAIEDLDEIWHFTCQNWSINQANTYYPGLIHLFNTLLAHPELGRDAGEIRRDYRSIVFNAHVVFYRVKPSEGIEIMRVLHQSMNIERLLK